MGDAAGSTAYHRADVCAGYLQTGQLPRSGNCRRKANFLEAIRCKEHMATPTVPAEGALLGLVDVSFVELTRWYSKWSTFSHSKNSFVQRSSVAWKVRRFIVPWKLHLRDVLVALTVSLTLLCSLQPMTCLLQARLHLHLSSVLYVQLNASATTAQVISQTRAGN